MVVVQPLQSRFENLTHVLYKSFSHVPLTHVPPTRTTALRPPPPLTSPAPHCVTSIPPRSRSIAPHIKSCL